MIRVCSHCRRIIGSRPEKPEADEKISHGLCPQCLAILEGKLRENTVAAGRCAANLPAAAAEAKLHKTPRVDPAPAFRLKDKTACLKSKTNG